MAISPTKIKILKKMSMPCRTFVAEIVYTVLLSIRAHTMSLSPKEFGTKKIWYQNYLSQLEQAERDVASLVSRIELMLLPRPFACMPWHKYK